MADDIQLPNELLNLSNVVEKCPEAFATGSKDIQVAALCATKFVFDLAIRSEKASLPHVVELLSSLTPDAAPQTRSQARAKNGKRKRSPSPPPKKPILVETPLPSLFVDGMNNDQIWEQLDLRAKKLCETLEEALEGTSKQLEDNEDEVPGGRDLRKVLIDGEAGLEELDGIDWNAEEGFDDDDEDDDDEDEDSEEHDEDLGEDITEDLRDPSSEEDNEDGLMLFDPHGEKPKQPRRKAGGHSELDDGFFDLASFNAEADEGEAMSVSKGRLGVDEEDDSDSDMSVDLFAPVDDAENFEEEDLEDAGVEPFYRDFFDPPPRMPAPKPGGKGKAKATPPANMGKVRFHEEVQVRNIKAKGKNRPLSTIYDDDDDDDDEEEYGEQMTFDDLEAAMDGGSEDDEEDKDESPRGEDEFKNEEGDSRDTMARLKDDLFADDEEPQIGSYNMSTHEKRLASLREQINELESENVAKKDWVLMGEATSRGRPQNSLLEEDLEFERLMKAVPVITEEIVQGLEERIKARILEGNFDDVVRLRPVNDKPFLPSRFFELQDTKSTQSLAQIYEDEYTAAQSGAAAGEDRDGKLEKEHDEIEKLWEGICGKLDALCNAHFMPKQPKATITTVSNISVATLESALPTSKSASTMLAPEEVFAPSPSDLRARSELTPTEKRAVRTKERKARKRTRDALDKGVHKYKKLNTKGMGAIKKQKEVALQSIVKSSKGVTVVGKKSKDILGKKEGKRYS
ncbi:hypothetical protein PILCRDRAFT_66715 [Piloderma croceum F 1598]|uniref:U3 small nucleolar ribonucleoprotein protein MPP10 n=1 Tax=Piloderma croceum (strain F 1598) TaxID=765440 RepID=A0A0C3FZT0_PILCF|nr:hypothetical protein PILCRDRAFT_66715 [Piloderma croceum F 1598]